MNPVLISYLACICFCIFLIIQSLIYYLFMAGNQVLRLKFYLPVIIIIALNIVFSDLMVFWNNFYPEAADLAYKLSIVFGIIGLFFYVLFLRFISVSIKGSTFVETDGYKKRNRIFLSFLCILCTLGIFSIFIFNFNQSRYFTVFQLLLALLLAGIGTNEQYEFNTILRVEKSKITPMNLVRYRILLATGIIAILSVIVDIILHIMKSSWFYSTLGSPIAYGSAILIMGLSLNFVFDYLNILTRSSDSNKRLMELNRQMMDDVRTAQSLQISLLPLDKQKFIQNFIDMEISYMPMQSVGGDYYDFYRLDDNNLLLFLGDASGHGVYAAMIWAILKVEVEELIENKYFDNLAQAFTLLNQRITRILENTYSYATLFACLINLENRTVHFISAGHTDQLYFSSLTRTVKRVRNKNPIIGTFKNAKFSADSINISSGDVLLLFSDGIIDGINPDGRQLGKENLEKIFLQVTKKEASASSIISDILIQLEDYFEGTLQKDDRTIMVIKL